MSDKIYAARLEPQQVVVYEVNSGTPHFHITTGGMPVANLIVAGDTLAVQFGNGDVKSYDMRNRQLIRG